VPQQLHESGKTDAEADHLGGISVAQLVRRYRRGAGRSFSSVREGHPKRVIQGINATKAGE